MEDAFTYNTDSSVTLPIPDPAPYDETLPPVPVEEIEGLLDVYSSSDTNDDLPPSPDGLSELKQCDPATLALVLQACKSLQLQQQQQKDGDKASVQDGSIALPLAAATLGAAVQSNLGLLKAVADKEMLQKEGRVTAARAVSVKG